MDDRVNNKNKNKNNIKAKLKNNIIELYHINQKTMVHLIELNSEVRLLYHQAMKLAIQYQ